MLGVLIIPLALAIWSRSGVVVANRSGDHSRLTTGARPWDFSSQFVTNDQVASLFTGKHLASGFESWRCGLLR